MNGRIVRKATDFQAFAAFPPRLSFERISRRAYSLRQGFSLPPCDNHSIILSEKPEGAFHEPPRQIYGPGEGRHRAGGAGRRGAWPQLCGQRASPAGHSPGGGRPGRPGAEAKRPHGRGADPPRRGKAGPGRPRRAAPGALRPGKAHHRACHRGRRAHGPRLCGHGAPAHGAAAGAGLRRGKAAHGRRGGPGQALHGVTGALPPRAPRRRAGSAAGIGQARRRGPGPPPQRPARGDEDLGPVQPGPDGAGAPGGAGPGDRAGGASAPGHADPLPPQQEQPRAFGRARRGQDRHRRGAGPADRPGRGAGSAAEHAHRGAGPRRDAGGDEVPGGF